MVVISDLFTLPNVPKGYYSHLLTSHYVLATSVPLLLWRGYYTLCSKHLASLVFLEKELSKALCILICLLLQLNPVALDCYIIYLV